MKPLLKWAGGKHLLAPKISEAFGSSDPEKTIYHEPFLGAGSVFLLRRSKGEVYRAVLSDINPKLIGFHKAVQTHVDDVLKALDSLPKEDWKEHYYEVRETFNEKPPEGPEHAARFIWLNKTCFNGLYRENKSGKFNVPVGSYKTLNFPTPEHFKQVSELLAGVKIRVQSFEEALNQTGPHSEVYCDPPYLPLSDTADFTNYSAEGFNFENQRQLAVLSMQAVARGATVVVSNHDVPVARNLYESFTIDSFEVRRSVSRGQRGNASEILAVKRPDRT